MGPQEWARVKELFELASALPRADQRGFIEKSTQEEQVQREVLRLLEVDPSETAVIDSPLPGGRLLQMLAGQTFSSLREDQLLLNRFRIVRLAGRGGMGEVYEAEDVQLRERVAVKTIRADIAGDARILERFRREISLSRQVTHPNVCRMFEIHEGPAQQWFITMEYLEGETLAEFLKREGPIPLAKAYPLIEQMAAGLAAAHAAGVVHRDFKSSNVYLAKDRTGGLRVVVTDFGLARYAPEGDASNQTTTGWGAGTPAYMAPEQMEGRAPGPPADLYALGVVMYEMSTGQPPYPGDSPIQVALRKVKERPVAPRTVNPMVDPKWEAVILRCLEIDPRDRYASATDVAPSLMRSPLVNLSGHRLRRWAVWAAGVALLIALGWGIARAGGSAGEPPPAVATWYSEGVSALQEGSLPTAKRAFEKTVEGAPGWADGYARLAQALDEMDQPDRARQTVLKALPLQPRWFGRSNLVDAVQALVSRDFRTAEAAFRSAMGQDPARRPGAAIDLARCLDRADRPRDALAVLDGLLRVVPDHPSANFNRALLGMRSNARPEVIQAGFDQAVRGFQPLNRFEALAETKLQLSLWRQQQAKIPEAMALARESLEAAQLAHSSWTEVRARFHLSRLTRETGGSAAEAQKLRDDATTLARSERFWAPLLNGQIDLGIQAVAQEELEQALETFTHVQQNARETESPRAEARAGYWIGLTQQRLERLAEAEQNLDKTRAFWLHNGFYREQLRTELALVAVWRKQGKDAEAARMTDEILKRVKEYGDHNLIYLAYVRQVTFLMNRGSYPQALELAQFLSEEAERSGFVEDQANAELEVARALLNLGQLTKAGATLQKMEARFRSVNQRLERLNLQAGLLVEQGQPEEALGIYREVQTTATEKKITRLKNRVPVGLCLASVQAQRIEQARQECAPLFAHTDNRQTAAGRDFLLADLFLLEKDFTQARARADRALGFYTKAGHYDNMLYALLIRGQADRRAGRSDALAATVQQAESVFSKIRQEWGAAAAEQYLQRAPYRTRWEEIHRAN